MWNNDYLIFFSLTKDMFMNFYMITRSFEDLVENLFGYELITFCSSRHLMICNGLTKWPKSNSITCIHGLGGYVVNYVIYDIPMYNQTVIFDISNNH